MASRGLLLHCCWRRSSGTDPGKVGHGDPLNGLPVQETKKRCCRQESDSGPDPSKLTPPSSSFLSEPLPSCRKLLRKRSGPSKVVLFPDEAWARNATSSYWTLTPVWWSRSRCIVVEVSGTRRTRTRARMEESSNGNLHIVGSFKTAVDPNFKLCLTARVSAADFNMGYSMTGTLERGCKRTNTFQVTHFAVIRRHEPPIVAH